MFAVIKTGGKQYVVKEGDVLHIEKLGVEDGRRILFDRVLLIEEGEKTLIGTPVLENAVIRATSTKTWEGCVQRRIDLLAESMAKKDTPFSSRFFAGARKNDLSYHLSC